MKITNVLFDKVKIKLKKPFAISRGTQEYCESIIVKISTDEGYYGFGESTPSSSVTGETVDIVISVLKRFKEVLMGLDPLSIEEIHHILNRTISGNTSAKAGVDIALYDIKGKVMNKPLYKVLGGFNNKVQTDITIGISSPEEMAQEAKEKVDEGFRILKIKTGMDPQKDIEAIKLIRNAVGKDIKLKIDANQGWNIHQTFKVLKEIEGYDVDSIEQPLFYWDFDGHTFLKSRLNIKLMLDESIHNSHDALRAVKANSCDMINIKLMKSGGLYEAEKVNAVAESAGIECMVGCMVETKIALTAGASLVAAKKNIVEADLDAITYYDKIDGIEGGFELDKDTILLSNKPGLGIEVKM